MLSLSQLSSAVSRLLMLTMLRLRRTLGLYLSTVIAYLRYKMLCVYTCAMHQERHQKGFACVFVPIKKHDVHAF